MSGDTGVWWMVHIVVRLVASEIWRFKKRTLVNVVVQPEEWFGLGERAIAAREEQRNNTRERSCDRETRSQWVKPTTMTQVMVSRFGEGQSRGSDWTDAAGMGMRD